MLGSILSDIGDAEGRRKGKWVSAIVCIIIYVMTYACLYNRGMKINRDTGIRDLVFTKMDQETWVTREWPLRILFYPANWVHSRILGGKPYSSEPLWKLGE